MRERGQAKPLPRHYRAVVRFLGYDPESVDGALADRLAVIRRRLGLTQADLAARLGLDEGTSGMRNGGADAWPLGRQGGSHNFSTLNGRDKPGLVVPT